MYGHPKFGWRGLMLAERKRKRRRMVLMVAAVSAFGLMVYQIMAGAV
jgi:predicted nucleic acid-binding Zn ribbon protein